MGKCIASGLPVLGHQGGELVELLGVELLDRDCRLAVHVPAPVAQLGAVGDLLGQRVLERVLDARLAHALTEQLGSYE